MHEGCLVALKRLHASGDLNAAAISARQQVLLVPQPDLSMCAQVAAAFTQSAELMLRLYSLTVQGNMQLLAGRGEPDSGPAAAAGEVRADGAAAGAAGPARGGVPGRGAGGRGQGRGKGRGGGGDSCSPAALRNKVNW